MASNHCYELREYRCTLSAASSVDLTLQRAAVRPHEAVGVVGGPPDYNISYILPHKYHGVVAAVRYHDGIRVAGNHPIDNILTFYVMYYSTHTTG